MSKKRGPSSYPQSISSEIWYYESVGRIHIYISAARIKEANGHGMNFVIPKARLKRSLERMSKQAAQPVPQQGERR